jgi:hypothetical protein
MKTKQDLCFVLALLTLCFFLVITGCGDDGGSEESDGDVAAVDLDCDANWDAMAGGDGRLTQTISVTFTVPDGYEGATPPDRPFTVGGAVTPNPAIPVLDPPKGNAFMDKTALLVPGEEYTYTTTFIDRFQTEMEICGEYFYMSVALYYYEPSFPVAAEWAYMSDVRYQLGGNEDIVITGGEMENNLLRD